MSTFLIFLLGIVVGVSGYKLAEKGKLGWLGYHASRARKKAERKELILGFVREKGKITNDEAQKLLGVSDSTATEYLNELEKENALKQVGDTGRSVYYTLR